MATNSAAPMIDHKIFEVGMDGSNAQQVVPLFTRYIMLLGLVSLAIGGLILLAVARGSAA